jgi:hypothetical protein
MAVLGMAHPQDGQPAAIFYPLAQDIQGVELMRRAFPKATRKFMMKEGKQLGDLTDLLMASTEGYEIHL